MRKQAICPLCTKPCGDHRPGAVVYHEKCLTEQYKPLLEKWAKERELKRQRLGYPHSEEC